MITDASWTSRNVLTLGGTIILAGAMVVGVVVLFFPVMAYRICYYLGGCQDTMDHFVDKLIAEQPREAKQKNNKRSVDYMQPLLWNLAKGFEKYGRPKEEV